MAKLDVNRMSNSTKVNRVDNQHNTTEEHLEDILGIPDNTTITSYVFGTDPVTGGKPIQSDGSIRGVPVLKSDSVEAAAADAVGFKFDDGAEARLLVFAGSELKIYRDSAYPDEDWDFVASVENPGQGLLTSLTDYEGPEVDDLGDYNGYLLKCTGSGFDLQAPDEGVGITTFFELEDGPGEYGDAGEMLISTGAGIDWGPAPSVAQAFVLFASVGASSAGWGTGEIETWGWSLSDPGDSGYVEDDETTYLGNDGLKSNKYFKNLPAGVYECSVWYYTKEGFDNTEGTREWWLTGTYLTGPAASGVAERVPTGFNTAGTLKAIDGTKYLGTRMFTLTDTSTNIVINVKQTSGGTIGAGAEGNVVFYACIRRIQ